MQEVSVYERPFSLVWWQSEVGAEDCSFEELVDLLLKLPGRFVVSGYEHPAYVPLEEAGWVRIDFSAFASSVAKTRKTGMRGSGSCSHQHRVESLWLDPKTADEVLSKQKGLSISEVE